MLKNGAHRDSNQEQVKDNKLVQVKNPNKSFQLNGEIFISSADIYDGLEGNSLKLVIQIQKELKMNNPLWEFKAEDKENSRNRKAIAQLKAKKIIESIPGTDMYIVNPEKVRKGKPLSIYGALYEYSRRMYHKDKNWRPTHEDIKRFVAPNDVILPDEMDIYLGI